MLFRSNVTLCRTDLTAVLITPLCSKQVRMAELASCFAREKHDLDFDVVFEFDWENALGADPHHKCETLESRG